MFKQRRRLERLLAVALLAAVVGVGVAGWLGRPTAYRPAFDDLAPGTTWAAVEQRLDGLPEGLAGGR